ncbi:hypothetical protein KRX56_03365 [Dermabacteraceae bacterium TAE3-ERU27]|nr:hypothetical protein [Dermabacteraceae bacterium TAE3-ERU27]
MTTGKIKLDDSAADTLYKTVKQVSLLNGWFVATTGLLIGLYVALCFGSRASVTLRKRIGILSQFILAGQLAVVFLVGYAAIGGHWASLGEGKVPFSGGVAAVVILPTFVVAWAIGVQMGVILVPIPNTYKAMEFNFKDFVIRACKDASFVVVSVFLLLPSLIFKADLIFHTLMSKSLEETSPIVVEAMAPALLYMLTGGYLFTVWFYDKMRKIKNYKGEDKGFMVNGVTLEDVVMPACITMLTAISVVTLASESKVLIAYVAYLALPVVFLKMYFCVKTTHPCFDLVKIPKIFYDSKAYSLLARVAFPVYRSSPVYLFLPMFIGPIIALGVNLTDYRWESGGTAKC